MVALPCTKLASEFPSWNKMQTPHSGHEGLTGSEPQPFSLNSPPTTLPPTPFVQHSLPLYFVS